MGWLLVHQLSVDLSGLKTWNQKIGSDVDLHRIPEAVELNLTQTCLYNSVMVKCILSLSCRSQRLLNLRKKGYKTDQSSVPARLNWCRFNPAPRDQIIQRGGCDVQLSLKRIIQLKLSFPHLPLLQAPLPCAPPPHLPPLLLLCSCHFQWSSSLYLCASAQKLLFFLSGPSCKLPKLL